MSPVLLRPSILEVERKFCRLAVATLAQNSGTPPFQSLRGLPTRTIHDIYFDKADVLYNAGIWVRRRNGAWEAKIRKGGDLTNSRFEEITDPEGIAACVGRIIARAGRGGDKDFGLEKMAEFTTTREAWIADREFCIVRDRMDFGHEVGEVELQAEMEGPTETEKRRVMGEMDERIEAFMQKYAWAFAPGKPVGKLVAYFEAMERKATCRS
ncbi:CYTH-like domain-containing protein [Cercophora newfieldiana]|uniref:CYTH-like domain-containing protein n=1 Tax=Cercophora newfieldiana TaxID=92897 RepID=A0AA40CXU9_9PEZI|nr:CYTH-like domain-containing protein [Cercophora newfieldiana]